jgi:hypothetical protein
VVNDRAPTEDVEGVVQAVNRTGLKLDGARVNLSRSHSEKFAQHDSRSCPNGDRQVRPRLDIGRAPVSAMRASAIVIWLLFVIAMASMTMAAETKLVYDSPTVAPTLCAGYDPSRPLPDACPPATPDYMHYNAQVEAPGTPLPVHCDPESQDPRCTGGTGN